METRRLTRSQAAQLGLTPTKEGNWSEAASFSTLAFCPLWRLHTTRLPKGLSDQVSQCLISLVYIMVSFLRYLEFVVLELWNWIITMWVYSITWTHSWGGTLAVQYSKKVQRSQVQRSQVQGRAAGRHWLTGLTTMMTPQFLDWRPRSQRAESGCSKAPLWVSFALFQRRGQKHLEKMCCAPRSAFYSLMSHWGSEWHASVFGGLIL